MAKRRKVKKTPSPLSSKTEVEAVGISPTNSSAPLKGLLSNWFKPVENPKRKVELPTGSSSTCHEENISDRSDLAVETVVDKEVADVFKTPRLRPRRKVVNSQNSDDQPTCSVDVKVKGKDKIRFSRKVKTVFITPLPDKMPGVTRMPVSPTPTDDKADVQAGLGGKQPKKTKLPPVLFVETIDLDGTNPSVDLPMEYPKAKCYECWPGNVCSHEGVDISSAVDHQPCNSLLGLNFLQSTSEDAGFTGTFKLSEVVAQLDLFDSADGELVYRCDVVETEDVPQRLAELKSLYPTVDVDRIFHRYKSRVQAEQSSEGVYLRDAIDPVVIQKSKRRKISKKTADTHSRKSGQSTPPSANVLCSLPWTDQFKPSCREDLLPYEGDVVEKIYRWLSSFNDARREKVKRDKYLRNSDSDSDSDAFEASIENPFTPGILVYGRTGIGKTSFVYALAAERGFNVLELNTSMLRSGTQLLKHIDGARSSHLVTLNAKEFSFHGGRSKEVERKSQSLILIDDVDILFEKDDGFWPAVTNVLSDCRVPVVMTCNTSSIKLIPDDLPVKRFELKCRDEDDLICRLQLMCLSARLLTVSDGFLRHKVSSSSYDVRSLINWMQFSSLPVATPQLLHSRVLRDQCHEDSSANVSLDRHLTLLCQLDTISGFSDRPQVQRKVAGSLVTEDFPLGLRKSDDVFSSLISEFDFVRPFTTQKIILPADYSPNLNDLERKSAINLEELCEKFYSIKSEWLWRQKNVLGLDVFPLLNQICSVEQRKKANGNKRRFQHYFDSHRVAVDPFELYRRSASSLTFPSS